ncbi:MAG: ABC transporter permease [Planctomycetia bacterium]|nr:ABC transporter permease [Planctomycetia bacterium]
MSEPTSSAKRTAVPLVRASLRHHRRMHLAVALGIAVTTAVLTGALLVGDSMRGSLRERALTRLGGIDELLVTDKFFRVELAAETTRAQSEFVCRPAIVLEGSVTQPDTKARAAGVTFLGLTDDWLADDVVYVNQTLADELNVKVGDEVILRLPAAREVPTESPLGRKNENVANSSRLKIGALPPPALPLADLTLRPNQQTPKNLFVSIKVLQKTVGKPQYANAIFATAAPAAAPGATPGAALDQRILAQQNVTLNAAFHPQLADYGLAWKLAKPGYFSLTSDRMLFDPALEKAVLETYKEFQPQQVFTYLANTIAAGSKQIPYSTIAALDMRDTPTLGPFRTQDGTPIESIADDEIVLSRWAAEDLGVVPGAQIRIAYFKPESTHGDVEEAEAKFKLKAIVDLRPNDDPFLTADLTPELPGVTDQLKMGDWDPPFPYDGKRVRDKDEKYWDDYRATPKAFVSQATGRRLWAGRFGDMTSLRIAPQPGVTLASLMAMFHPNPASVGFAFQPIKLRALEASSGTTPFEGLFIGFSFFIIAAALMLTSLLFRLGVEQRAAEVGLLLAVGLDARHVQRLLLREGALVAALGAALGLALGVGYAALMLAGLRTLWLDAVTVPFLTLFITPRSLLIGYATGVLVSLATIGWSLRSLRKRSIRRLLAGQAAESDLSSFGPAGASRSRKGLILQWGSVALAIVAAVAASRLTDEAQAGAFFGSAALVLTALLTFLRRRLSAARFGSLITPGPGRVVILALRNAGRNPGRSTLTIGLVASAAFLIVAVSAFRLTPPSTFVEKSSGTGGFALVAQSDLPILPDMNTDDGRLDLNFSQAGRKVLDGTQVYPFRFRPGDDASCLNLYQTTQPRILGAGEAFVERGGFSWASSAASGEAERANPWLLLRKPIVDDPQTTEDESQEIPVVLDQATAIYSLHLSGVGAKFNAVDAQSRGVRLRVVGLLRNSVLQGSLVIHEKPFERSFPEVSGYRFFLVAATPEQASAVATTLESTLSDYGFDVERSERLLAGFLAVQNTYLSTFQSLGGLGLLLGTFGLAVVQLRNVLERRGELALLRAVGLSKSFLSRLVFWENIALLVGGLGCGVVAAATAVLPHALLGGASVPWVGLAATLGTVLVVGLATGWIVVRSVLKRPLLSALRGE